MKNKDKYDYLTFVMTSAEKKMHHSCAMGMKS